MRLLIPTAALGYAMASGMFAEQSVRPLADTAAAVMTTDVRIRQLKGLGATVVRAETMPRESFSFLLRERTAIARERTGL